MSNVVTDPSSRIRWYQLPIRTQLPRVPWAWCLAMQMPWFVFLYIEFCSSVTVTFTLRKFIEHPQLIALVGSLNTAYNMIIGASANYASDKVWTRFGRRRPFLLIALVSAAGFLVFIPFVPSFALLLVVLVFYEAARDLASPQEALQNEVIPPQQRGRATVFRTFAIQGVVFFFFTVMVGKFDETYDLAGKLTISGETVIYWTGALLALGLAAFYLFAVREQKPPALVEKANGTSGESILVIHDHYPAPMRRLMARANAGRLPFVVRILVRFFVDVFGERQMRFLFLFMISSALVGASLGNLTPLLFTDQWQFSKDTYGNIIGYGTPAVLILAPIAGWLVDRFDRLTLTLVGAVGVLLQNIGMIVYLRFIDADGVPPVWFMIAWPLTFALFSQAAGMASVTMVFDYLPSSRMGTFGSGWGLTSALLTLIVTNGVAAFITAFSALFPVEGVKYNYFSGYYLVIVLICIGIAGMCWFARERRRGTLVPYGVLERQVPPSA